MCSIGMYKFHIGRRTVSLGCLSFLWFSLCYMFSICWCKCFTCLCRSRSFLWMLLLCYGPLTRCCFYWRSECDGHSSSQTIFRWFRCSCQSILRGFPVCRGRLQRCFLDNFDLLFGPFRSISRTRSRFFTHPFKLFSNLWTYSWRGKYIIKFGWFRAQICLNFWAGFSSPEIWCTVLLGRSKTESSPTGKEKTSPSKNRC